MNTNNDVTGDRITNALKGNKEKYREGWEAIFGKNDQENTKGKDFPMTREEFQDWCSKQSKKILDDVDPFLVRYNTEHVKEDILDELTKIIEEEGFYGDE